MQTKEQPRVWKKRVNFVTYQHISIHEPDLPTLKKDQLMFVTISTPPTPGTTVTKYRIRTHILKFWGINDSGLGLIFKKENNLDFWPFILDRVDTHFISCSLIIGSSK